MPASTRNQDEAVEHYALLHRAVEGGDATDVTRQRLIRVCIELDKRGEAVDAFHTIADPALRRASRRELARIGWVPAEQDDAERKSLIVTDAALNPSLREKLEDAVQLLCDERMRMPVVAGTVAFPIALGVGGVFASGSTFFLLPLLALAPALLLLGMVGALGRHVLILAIQGRDDTDGLPRYAQLLREAWPFLRDFLPLAVVFLVPAGLLSWLGAPLLGLPLLLLAAFVLPLVTALRLTGNEWRSLKPARVVAAIKRLTPPYPAVAGAVAGLLAPALLVMFVTAGMHVFLVVSLIGPLLVAPSLMAARIMGLTLHFERARLGDLFKLPARPRYEPASRQRAKRRE